MPVCRACISSVQLHCVQSEVGLSVNCHLRLISESRHMIQLSCPSAAPPSQADPPPLITSSSSPPPPPRVRTHPTVHNASARTSQPRSAAQPSQADASPASTPPTHSPTRPTTLQLDACACAQPAPTPLCCTTRLGGSFHHQYTCPPPPDTHPTAHKACTHTHTHTLQYCSAAQPSQADHFPAYTPTIPPTYMHTHPTAYNACACTNLVVPLCCTFLIGRCLSPYTPTPTLLRCYHMHSLCLHTQPMMHVHIPRSTAS
jgi:hypothetical protein